MQVEDAVKIDEGMMLRIAHEIISYDKWHGFVSYATDLYGEAAYEIEATTTSNYDDEGGYFDAIVGITVKDRSGHILEFAYTTEFWTQELDGVSAEEREDKADDIARTYWIDLYPTAETIYVDEEPLLSFKELYAVLKES